VKSRHPAVDAVVVVLQKSRRSNELRGEVTPPLHPPVFPLSLWERARVRGNRR